jgi:type I restriction enzyme S subunit
LKINIPLPPLPEQRRIAARLDKSFAELDAGMALLKQAKDGVMKYRAAVLEKEFSLAKAQRTQREDSVTFAPLRELVTELGDGLHGTPKYDTEGDYFFINGNNLAGKIIQIKNETKKTSESEYKKYKKNLNENTVFVSINGTLGNTAFYNNEKVILGKSACYFNVKPSLLKEYVRYYLLTNTFKKYVNNNATGSTIRNLSLDAMRKLPIPLLSLQEQQQIVSRIESRFTACDEVDACIDNCITKAAALRQSLLKKAFEGRLTER